MTDGDRDGPDNGECHAGGAPRRFSIARYASMHLVDLAAEIERADSLVSAVTENKLVVILQQIRQLQQEAASVMNKARTDGALHRVACGFRKRVGGTYHLYRQADGELYWSLLSPDDWASAPPHVFEGSYRLESDMSWTPLEHAAERDAWSEVARGIAVCVTDGDEDDR